MDTGNVCRLRSDPQPESPGVAFRRQRPGPVTAKCDGRRQIGVPLYMAKGSI